MNKMDKMLSREEIDNLLGKTADKEQESEVLTPEEKDALGEIGNISMGTSATTLFALLGNKVTITTPAVEIIDVNRIAEDYPIPFLAVNIWYTDGIEGTNLLLLKESDASIIADLMMGGDGTKPAEDMNELTISAVSEAMNQMIGSASTSLSTMFDKPISISPPESLAVDLSEDYKEIEFFRQNEKFVRVSFKMVVGDLIDSEIMQLLPIQFSKSMVRSLMDKDTAQEEYSIDEDLQEIESVLESLQGEIAEQGPELIGEMAEQGPEFIGEIAKQKPQPIKERADEQKVKIQPISLKSFDDASVYTEKENIGLILDVPLNVTVELGRTKKQIKEILEFGVDTIVELDKLAGEPVELLVNGKFIAKGEVVVIDENFGVRITDIVHPSKRIDSISSDR